MRCEYRFKVDGKLRLEKDAAIDVDGMTFQFHTVESGRVAHISVIVPVPRETDWPTVAETPQAREKASINIPSPGWTAFREELRTIEGMLSLHGLDSIETDTVRITWLPESADEAARLQLHSIEIGNSARDDREFPSTAFDVVARCVLGAAGARDLQVPLSFFRKGRLDMIDRRFIEAFYDFYFVIETLFANGKSRAAAVKQEFAASTSAQ
jgi:hypothetical protein